MYRSDMDAIDYEPDASLFEESDDDYDYDYERDSGGSEGGLNAWGDYSDGSDGYSGDSDEESQKFPANNLRNPKSFPSYSQCAPFELYDSRDWNNEPIPPPRHWCYLGEIVEHMTVPIRNILTVKDKDGESTHLSTNFDLEAQFDVKVGSTMLYCTPRGNISLLACMVCVWTTQNLSRWLFSILAQRQRPRLTDYLSRYFRAI
ncbi:hypothetical protein B0H19DRAFT_482290 [Mycena capillaripes]|nr:hypothetical protein B0H19DRAFT_482290 [Mycena capillaripes]